MWLAGTRMKDAIERLIDAFHPFLPSFPSLIPDVRSACTISHFHAGLSLLNSTAEAAVTALESPPPPKHQPGMQSVTQPATQPGQITDTQLALSPIIVHHDNHHHHHHPPISPFHPSIYAF
jgi:hypothetical protein